MIIIKQNNDEIKKCFKSLALCLGPYQSATHQVDHYLSYIITNILTLEIK